MSRGSAGASSSGDSRAGRDGDAAGEAVNPRELEGSRAALDHAQSARNHRSDGIGRRVVGGDGGGGARQGDGATTATERHPLAALPRGENDRVDDDASRGDANRGCRAAQGQVVGAEVERVHTDGGGSHGVGGAIQVEGGNSPFTRIGSPSACNVAEAGDVAVGIPIVNSGVGGWRQQGGDRGGKRQGQAGGGQDAGFHGEEIVDWRPGIVDRRE